MSAPSVPLPRRENNASSDTQNDNHPPIWAVQPAHPSVEAPLPVKCDRYNIRREGVCCKELKGDDERSLIDPDVVRDV